VNRVNKITHSLFGKFTDIRPPNIDLRAYKYFFHQVFFSWRIAETVCYVEPGLFGYVNDWRINMELDIQSTYLNHKWRTLLLLSLAELLAMGVWFSASAVVPALAEAWTLNDAGRAWLTMSVQIGFVVGSLGSAVFNMADRVPARRLFTVSAALAAIATGLIPLATRSLGPALFLRFMTGLVLVGVYPVGMKIMATWTREDRGLGIGLLVGALTIGSAFPHFINAFGGVGSWRGVLYVAAGLALLGALLSYLFVDEGPYQTPAPRFDWRYLGKIARQRELVLANLGYLGHMWELFAMWTWIPIFLLGSFALVGVQPMWASLAAFSVIAIGGLGSLLAGPLADRLGRTIVTSASLVISGICAVLIGQLYGGNPLWLVAACLIWGFAIVADSAQFSASISELCQKEYTGTALTVQTSLGFLLTLVTIRLIPTLEQQVGWEWAFAFLALGPVVGIWAMLSLRRLPAALRMAGGRR
jgi:MFS family permease